MAESRPRGSNLKWAHYTGLVQLRGMGRGRSGNSRTGLVRAHPTRGAAPAGFSGARRGLSTTAKRAAAPLCVWREPSIAGDPGRTGRFTVSHPFHPLSGRQFELVGYAHSWGEHRVFFRMSGEERVRSMPARWTDVEGVDPTIAIGEGRTHFRVDDLIALARILRSIEERGGVR